MFDTLRKCCYCVAFYCFKSGRLSFCIAWGGRGRKFKSCRSDHSLTYKPFGGVKCQLATSTFFVSTSSTCSKSRTLHLGIMQIFCLRRCTSQHVLHPKASHCIRKRLRACSGLCVLWSFSASQDSSQSARASTRNNDAQNAAWWRHGGSESV